VFGVCKKHRLYQCQCHYSGGIDFSCFRLVNPFNYLHNPVWLVSDPNFIDQWWLIQNIYFNDIQYDIPMVSPIFYPQSNSIRIGELDSEPILLSSHFLHRPWHRNLVLRVRRGLLMRAFSCTTTRSWQRCEEHVLRFQKNMAVEATTQAN
jgi:hypothetical protein